MVCKSNFYYSKKKNLNSNKTEQREYVLAQIIVTYSHDQIWIGIKIVRLPFNVALQPTDVILYVCPHKSNKGKLLSTKLDAARQAICPITEQYAQFHNKCPSSVTGTDFSLYNNINNEKGGERRKKK
jgi:hypothetical protein